MAGLLDLPSKAGKSRVWHLLETRMDCAQNVRLHALWSPISFIYAKYKATVQPTQSIA